MKKILLTLTTAALFSVAAIAQERNTTQTQSNQFRNSQQPNAADQAVDSTSSDFQQSVNDTRQDVRQAGENVREESQNLRDTVEQQGTEFRQNAQETGNDIRQGVQGAGNGVNQATPETGESLQANPNRTESDMKQNPPKGDGTQSMENNGNGQAGTDNALEVLESKEGPDNEVVYKYQGGLFYIDRDEKKLVKVEESDLQDSKHQVIVKDNTNANESDGNSDQSSNRKPKQ